MMVKSHDIIKSKIKRFPMQMLLKVAKLIISWINCNLFKDKDFIDSVFFRFALMRLPLRTSRIFCLLFILIFVFRGYWCLRGFSNKQSTAEKHGKSFRRNKIFAKGTAEWYIWWRWWKRQGQCYWWIKKTTTKAVENCIKKSIVGKECHSSII